MHGRRLATTEEVVAIVTPDSQDALDRLESWTTTHDIGLTVVEIGTDVTHEHVSEARETIGVTIGGDGAFLEGVRQFTPHRVPVIGVNTGTLAFLARVDPRDLDAALTEVLRGRAVVNTRQQYTVQTAGIDTTGVNEVFIEKTPPDERHGTKVGSLHVFIDDEYVGEYFGSGLLVSTPTGSTGRSFSNRGPVHYPNENRSLQIVPHETINASASPIVVSEKSDVYIVLDTEFNVDIDGGREYKTVGANEVIHITGASNPAHTIRTSYDDPFITALVDKLGWSLRDVDDAGPVDALPSEDTEIDFLTRACRVAREAARSAGEPLRELHGKVEQIEYKSSKSDIVTEADYQAEHIITTAIKNEFPNHGIRSEENVSSAGSGQYIWSIDPLDGTGNFTHGNPNYAVSIALIDADKGEPVVGVVYNPETNEMFYASDGNGAYQNGSPITPTDRDRLDESMLLSGYDPDGGFLSVFYQKTQGVRRLGSAALNLAYVATGSADAVWEYDTYPWDVSAGICILREAGGQVTNDVGERYAVNLDASEDRTPLLGSNGTIHEALLEHLSDAEL